MKAHDGAGAQNDGYLRVERFLEWPMMVLAVVFLGALVAEQVCTLTPIHAHIVQLVSVSVWVAFAVEYILLLVLGWQLTDGISSARMCPTC